MSKKETTVRFPVRPHPAGSCDYTPGESIRAMHRNKQSREGSKSNRKVRWLYAFTERFQPVPYGQPLKMGECTVVDIGGAMVIRFCVLPRLYLHEHLNTDTDRHFADQPWGAISLVISGGLWEERPDRSCHPSFHPPTVFVFRRFLTFRRFRNFELSRIQESHVETWTLYLRGKQMRSLNASPVNSQIQGKQIFRHLPLENTP